MLGALLFVVPFLGRRQVTDWKAPDPARKTELPSGEDEGALDVPYLEDVADFAAAAEEYDFDLGGADLDAVIAEASRRLYGRDFRGHFAEDSAAYEERFVERAGDPYRGRAVDSAPIDLEAAAATGLFRVERLVPGERVYHAQCAGCHGLAGDGSGPASRFLDPRPRNFRRGKFKFTTTPSGSRPRREDLFRTVTEGLVGSAMPRFHLLPEEKRWDVVEYVRFLAIQGEFEQLMLDIAWNDEEIPDPDEVAELVNGRWRGLKEVYPGSVEPPYDPASIARGREIFTTTTCFQCHGMEGKGDGPTAQDYEDAWGYPIVPRDFTGGELRVGLESKELWVLIAHGLDGTPMPAAISAMSSDDVWHLVHYVQSLSAPDGERP